MATALDVVTRAQSKCRVLGIGREPKAAEAALGLDELNDMLAEWEIDGINLAPVELALTDVIDVPRNHLTAIVLALAARIAGTYGAELSPIDAASLERRFAILRAYHFTIKTIGIDHIAAIPRRQTD